jgi:signal transduction histidine kinase
MGRMDRRMLMASTAVIITTGAVAVWLALGGPWQLAVAVEVAIGAAVCAIAVAWRLAERLDRCREAMHQGEPMRLLGQVSGGLAHQLRNGVTGAKLAIQLHARSCAGGDTESLDVARRQLARVEADLARFLDMGRADSSRRACPIVELVEHAVALLRPQFRHADVQLCWEPPAVEPVVVGDPGRLGHIVINLLANAIEAAGAGGDIEIDIDQIAGDRCAIEVWDSGPGPAAGVARRLFEPFVTGKSDGVGLGLFVARQAAEAHGGRLNWRRERNRTCFRVELPVENDMRTQTPAVAVDASR